MQRVIADEIKLGPLESPAHAQTAGPWAAAETCKAAQETVACATTADAKREGMVKPAPGHARKELFAHTIAGIKMIDLDEPATGHAGAQNAAQTMVDARIRDVDEPAIRLAQDHPEPRQAEGVSSSMNMVSWISITASTRMRVVSDVSAQAKTNTPRSRVSSRSTELPVSSASKSTRSLASRVRKGSTDVADGIMDIASFDGCEGLLRGSYLSVVLRGQAAIFAHSGGSASTYALSQPAKMIDAFISHNWCVPRWRKYICLVFHFNLRIAYVAGFLLTSPLCVLSVYGMVPAVQYEFAEYPRSYVFRVFVYPTAMLVLVFYGEVARLFPRWTPTVFLDKTCIHQENRAIQRKGIEKLGAFLCYSKTMVICYTDLYLLKLWTVYEVASFLTLQSAEQMRVIPTNFPIVYMSTLMFIYIAGSASVPLEIASGFYFGMTVVLCTVAYGILITFRRWSRSKIEIRDRIATFNARNCKCFCEEDRPIVYANIGILMKATQDIAPDAGEDEVLACFDNLVRNHLYEALILSVGKYSMRYEHAVMCGIAFITPVLDAIVGLAHGLPLTHWCAYALWYGIVICTAVPMFFVMYAVWSDRCLQITGCMEHLYLMVGYLMSVVMVFGLMLMLDVVEAWAKQSTLRLLVFFILFLVTTAVTRNVYRPRHTGVARRTSGRLEAIQKAETRMEDGNEKHIRHEDI